MTDQKQFELNVDDLTVGDLETIEELTGLEFDEAIKGIEALRPKCVLAFVYCIGRQADPEFTLDDARRVKLSAIAHEDAEDPAAEEGAEPAGPPVAPTA